MITVKIINKSNNELPTYATPGSAGIDLRANLVESVMVSPGKRVLVPTGIFLEMPDTLEAQVRPRSGLAFKEGLTVLNTPGTIDSDYTGEIGVILINLGESDVTIKPGTRIAQLVFSEITRPTLLEVDQIRETSRGSGGFGHTGQD